MQYHKFVSTPLELIKLDTKLASELKQGGKQEINFSNSSMF